MNAKELILNACGCRHVARAPVWLMRQVGRYMPSYRRLRERVSFADLIRKADLAAQATLSINEICDPDVLIIFSDILTVPAGLGAEVVYEPRLTVKAPAGGLAASMRDEWVVPAYETIKLVKKAAGDQKAVMGFAGAPYTLYSYLAGQGPEIRSVPLRDRAAAQKDLDAIAQAVALHLRRQAEAGADVLQIFDTQAGELAPHHYETFALAPLKAVLRELSAIPCPIVLYARGRNHVDFRSSLPGIVLSVDWTVPLDSIPDGAALAVQGNLDPAILLAGPEVTRAETERMLDTSTGLGGYIANLGHGVLPGTPLESVQEFVSTAKLKQLVRKAPVAQD